MMRICHVTSMHERDDDRIFERACAGLARAGHDVVLVAPADGDGEVDGVRIAALPRRAGVARRLLSSRDAVRRAATSGAEVIHFHDPDLLPWVLPLARRHRVVYDIHENYVARFRQWRLPAPLRALATRAFRALEHAVIRRIDGIVTTTETMGASYDGVARRRAVVRNVPDLERLAGVCLDVGKEERPVVLTSGTNSPHRNCLPTIEAVPEVARAIPDVLFRFLGRYAPTGFQRRMQSRVSELGIEPNVELGGMVPWRENFTRTARAHVGLVFYADDENNRVTMPNRLFEAMLCGVAVVAHDFPELRRVVEGCGCGVVVDSSDPAEIARAVTGLLAEPGRAAEMGLRGRAAVLERYNFAVELEGMVGLYRDVVAAANGGR